MKFFIVLLAFAVAVNADSNDEDIVKWNNAGEDNANKGLDKWTTQAASEPKELAAQDKQAVDNNDAVGPRLLNGVLGLIQGKRDNELYDILSKLGN